MLVFEWRDGPYEMCMKVVHMSPDEIKSWQPPQAVRLKSGTLCLDCAKFQTDLL